MLISTKGRYALRMMLDLAQNDTGEPVKLKDIASRQYISEKYCEQIIAILNKAGYVRSVRGAQGGYLLASPPSQYTAGQILRLTEGDLSAVQCISEGSDFCARTTSCVTRKLWQQVTDAVNGILDNTTLEDLLSWGPSKGDDYVI